MKAGDVDLDAGLGEGEEVRAQPDVALAAEDRARELQQRALEVGEGDVRIDGKALDLVELRRVRGVGVGPVDASGDHHVKRRRVRLHRAHLHRRGVRAQHELPAAGRALDVEGVGARPRGVRGAVVERVEVVVDGLDLGALHDGEAEPEEDVFELAARGGKDVQAADRLRWGAGQRHVDAVGEQALLELAR